jgi:hypothetical protein
MSACPCCEREVAPLNADTGRWFQRGAGCGHIGGDFHNYLLPLLPQLPPGRLRGLHDSNLDRLVESLPSLPERAITAKERNAVSVLIACCRFSANIRAQLRQSGMRESLLFDLSDLLGPVNPVTA